MKKVLSIVLSLVMVLCMMPAMAFAGTDAAYTDIAGETCENAVTTLSGLGVVDGYPDGSYKPEVAVKRAEAAKLIIAALGLTEEATGTKASFTDLAGYEWAEGYIGYAEALGILKGDGNGLYRPADTVSYNEMAAIVIRALGYTDEALQGSFPAAHVAKAKALGAFKDVVSGGSAGANRGDCAIMIFNVLDEEMVNVDGEGLIQGIDEYMIELLGSDATKFAENAIVDIDELRNSLIDLTSYVGVQADLHKNAKGKVIAITNIDSTILVGKTNADTTSFVVDGVSYKLPTTVTGLNAVVNSEDTGTVNLAANSEYTMAVEVVGKTIKSVHSVISWSGKNIQWAKADAKAVAAATPKFLAGTDADITLPLNDNREIDYTKFDVVGADSLAAIPEKAIVTFYTIDSGAELVKVEVSTATVTGKVTEKVTATGNVVINGVSYPVSGATVNVGDEGTFYLNYAGKICVKEATTSAVNYGLVTYMKGKDTSVYGQADVTKIQILTAAGAKTNFVINKDSTVAANPEVGTPVSYTLNAAGEITGITVLDMVNGTNYVTGYINNQKVADDVVVFTGNSAETYAVGSVSALPVNKALSNVSFYKDTTLNGTGLVQVIVNNATTDEIVYGFITAVDQVENADGDTVAKVTLANGATYLAKKDYSVSVSNANLMKITLKNGVVDSVENNGLAYIGGEVKAVDATAISVGNTGYVQVNTSAEVYKWENNKVTAITYDDIEVGKTVYMMEKKAEDLNGYDIIIMHA